MLQLLYNTSIKANSLNANMSMSTWFLIYACLKCMIMVMPIATDTSGSPVGKISGKIHDFALFEE